MESSGSEGENSQNPGFPWTSIVFLLLRVHELAGASGSQHVEERIKWVKKCCYYLLHLLYPDEELPRLPFNPDIENRKGPAMVLRYFLPENRSVPGPWLQKLLSDFILAIKGFFHSNYRVGGVLDTAQTANVTGVHRMTLSPSLDTQAEAHMRDLGYRMQHLAELDAIHAKARTKFGHALAEIAAWDEHRAMLVKVTCDQIFVVMQFLETVYLTEPDTGSSNSEDDL